MTSVDAAGVRERNLAGRVAIVMALPGPPAADARTRSALQASAPGVALVEVDQHGSAALVESVARCGTGDAARHVLVATDHLLLGADGLVRAVQLLDDDPRIATVSFAADDRPASTPFLLDGPGVDDRPPTPVPVPVGALTLLSHHALGRCGGLAEDLDLSPQALVVDFALRARECGFGSVLDVTTIASRPTGVVARPDPADTAERSRLEQLHPILASSSAAAQAASSPLALARGVVTASLRGLSVTIDGTSLRPEEMGTQVLTTSLIQALVARDDVARLCVVVNREIPPYAAATLQHQKVDVTRITGLDLSGIAPCDIIHRPFQPDSSIPFDNWRSRGSRIVVSLLDLILYEIGTYWPDGPTWMAFRDMLRHTVASCDAVTVISEDVRARVLAEALPVDPSRLFAVTLGADHLRGDEPMSSPRHIAEHEPMSAPFLLVLGTDYPHKNRDIAVDAWRLLRRTHPDLRLVLAGPSMPFGPSGATTPLDREDGLIVLADVSTAERNWLLGHAAVVLYPTSAEGFGFVPFEAARFGTPTVHVPFGPLREVYGTLPVAAATWTAEAFAAATDELLLDSTTSRRQVDAVDAAAAHHTWAGAADRLVEVYRSVLSRPAVQLGSLDAAQRDLVAARAESLAARDQLDAIKASRSYRLAVRIAAAARVVRR